MNLLKSAERFGKEALTFLFRIFIKQENISVNGIDLSKIDKILIIRQDRRIGNLILTTPLIQKAKDVFPNADIDILIAESNLILCEDNPHVSKIYPFNHTRFVYYPFCFLKLTSRLRKNRYPVVIESSKPSSVSFLNGYLAYLTKSQIRIGFEKGSGAIFTNVHVKPDLTKHYSEIQQDLVNFLSVDKDYYKPQIFPNKYETKRMSDMLNQKFNIQEQGLIIGIWIGARGKKKWDIENFIKLFNQIKSETEYFPILAFGIEEKEDYSNIDKENFNTFRIKDLRILKSFLSSCNVFVCGDTGPLHFSYALGIPTIGIFLEDSYVRYGYTDGDKNLIVKPSSPETMIDEIVKSINKILT
jgi:ADP-heptose:LPS heptosyltransferase